MNELKNIQENIDKNPDIQPKIKNMIKDVFSNMYNFLGETGFKKWLIDDHFASVARKMICKVLTSKKDKYLEEKPTVVGYYAKTKDNKQRKIILRKKMGDNEYIATHEVYHALVDGEGTFSRFFGEGITEFLNRTMHKTDVFSYRQNVEVVALLYAMYSDRIFKYYFTKQGASFFFDIAKETNGRTQELMLQNNDLIETHFAKFHEIKYSHDLNDSKENSEANKELKLGLDAIIRNFYMYKKSQIQQLQYMSNGQVDFDRFIKDMALVFSAYDKIEGRRDSKLIDGINSLLINQLIQDSHLLVGLDPDVRQKAEARIRKDISSGIEDIRIKYKWGMQIPGVIIDQQCEPYRTLNENVKEKLLQKFSQSNPSDLNLGQNVEMINYIARATNMSEEEIDTAIKNLDIERIPCDTTVISRTAQKYSVATANLQALKAKSENNFESTRYVQIDLDCLPHTRAYIEFVDRRDVSLLLINGENGNINKLALNENGELLSEEGVVSRLHNKRSNYTKLPQEVKNEDRVFEVFSLDTKKSAFIGIPEDHSEPKIEYNKLKVSNGEIVGKIGTFSEMREEVLSQIVLEDISKKIESGKYSSNKSQKKEERQDFDSRYIYFDNFIEDYNAMVKIFDDVDESKEELQDLTGKLLDRTFEIDRIPQINDGKNNEAMKKIYSEKKANLQQKFIEFANIKSEGYDDETERKLRGDINGLIFEINQGVKSLIQGKDISKSQDELLNPPRPPKTQTTDDEPIPMQKTQSSAEFLQSAIRATKKTTRISQLKEQLRNMQGIRQRVSENRDNQERE